MASITSAADRLDWPGKRLNHAQFSAALAARRAALGNLPTPRNAGFDRTASKRALLAAIEDNGGAW